MGIDFPNNQFDPIGIFHPDNGNDMQFFITSDGLYLVEWTFTANNPNGDSIASTLFDAENFIFLDPSPNQTAQLNPGEDTTITAHATLQLFENQSISLQVISENGGLLVTIPAISFIELVPQHPSALSFTSKGASHRRTQYHVLAV